MKKWKNEAVLFLGEEMEHIHKQTITRKLNELKKEHDNERKRIQGVI